MLCERNQRKKYIIHMSVHLCKLLRDANICTDTTQSSGFLKMEEYGKKRAITKGYIEAFRSDGYIHYPDFGFTGVCAMCLVARSCLTLCNPMDHSPPGSSVHGDSLGKNTGVDCHALLRGSSQPRIKPRSPALQADSLPPKPTRLCQNLLTQKI